MCTTSMLQHASTIDALIYTYLTPGLGKNVFLEYGNVTYQIKGNKT